MFDIKNSNITSTHIFKEASNCAINDIVAIDDTHYLLATDWGGLLKTTKDKLLKNYY